MTIPESDHAHQNDQYQMTKGNVNLVESNAVDVRWQQKTCNGQINY